MCKSWQVYSYDLQFVHLGPKSATSAMDQWYMSLL